MWNKNFACCKWFWLIVVILLEIFFFAFNQKCNSSNRATNHRTIELQVTNPSHYQLSYQSLLNSKDYDHILMDNKITVSILTHRCQCPHDRLKRGGDRGGATNIHKRKLSSEPHVKKRYKWRNHLFYTPWLIVRFV